MKINKIILTVICFLFPLYILAQVRLINNEQKPKLIVGIVIDQMRYDYLTRYWNKFGENGFKKLVGEGFSCSNTQCNYIPTVTGPGHAAIYTGTTPSIHGIVGNNWYSRDLKRSTYVTEDNSVKGIGTDLATGKMSPHYMLSTTITDELRLASNFRSKVIGVALKDRSSILPAGHAANAAYWYDDQSGNWISSNWYIEQLPKWVLKFNARKMADSILNTTWNTLLPIDQYTESTADDVKYEEAFPGETKPVFPHHLNLVNPPNYELVRKCPLGVTLTREFAMEAMKQENLGKGDFTDFLAISFAPPDYVGHQFGVNSIEQEDMYIRLDAELADLISETEAWCGKENILFFLTADHAAISNPVFLQDHKIPAGYLSINTVRDTLDKLTLAKYGHAKIIRWVYNDQVYFNDDSLQSKHMDKKEISEFIADFLRNYPGINYVLTSNDLLKNEYRYGIRSYIQNGYYFKRSGDIAFSLDPGIIEYKLSGTTHSSSYEYDTHIPLIFYGWKIPKGVSAKPVNITDIAPTLSQILGISSPNGCTGIPINDLLK